MKRSSVCLVVLFTLTLASTPFSQTQPTTQSLPAAPKMVLFSSLVANGGFVRIFAAVRSPNNSFVFGGTEGVDGGAFYESNLFTGMTYTSDAGNPNYVTALTVSSGLQVIAGGAGSYLGGTATSIQSCVPSNGILDPWVDGGSYVTCIPGLVNGPTAIAIDSANSVYVASGPTVFKISSTPALIYTFTLGGSATNITGLAVNKQGQVYVVGNAAKDLPTLNALQPVGNGAFLAKLNATGTGVLFATYLNGKFGGTSADAVAINPSGVFVTGYAGTKASPTVYVSKVLTSGQKLVYHKAIGPGSPVAIAVDAKNRAYVTGQTTSTQFPLVRAFQIKPASGFVASLDGLGKTILWSSYLGGSGFADSMTGIGVNSDGTTWIGGTAGSIDFPVTDGSMCDPSFCESGFMTKISAN